MSEVAIAGVSYAEYLAIEDASELKHEYLDGVVRAMAGGTIEHGRLGAEIIHRLQLEFGERRCQVFSSDTKIHIAASRRTTYADAVVVCGDVQRSELDSEAIANPIVIVEVLSPTTEAYDRGEKFRHYRRLSGVREYVLVSQAPPLVEVWRRDGDAWRVAELGPTETVRLASIDVSLPIDALYAGAVPPPTRAAEEA